MAAPAQKFGLALGGGGARGLAHIAVLEAFDELGIKPAIIAGTSIGALIGAAYASGMPAAEIHSYCAALLAKRGGLLRHIYSRWQGPFRRYWNPRNAERLLEFILPAGLPDTFEGLRIPLLTVATDFYTHAEHVTSKGALLPAIAASSALPALLKPVELGGCVLIDGGFVNPLPFDLLRGKASFIIAVDVSGGPDDSKGGIPRAIDTVLGAQQIALRSIINAKLKASRPDVLIRPPVGHYRVLDFLRYEEILSAAAPVKDDTKSALRQLRYESKAI
jgi:NTE family protein